MNKRAIFDSGEQYEIEYDSATETVRFQGSLRRMGMKDYEPIEELLNKIIEQEPPVITLDVRHLKLLNSAGIRVLSKFVIRVRSKKNIQVIIEGSKDSTWQDSSLKNLQRLMPSPQLELRLYEE